LGSKNVLKRLLKRVVVTGMAAESGVAVAAVFKRHQWLVVGVDSVYSPTHVHQFYLISSGTRAIFHEEMLLIVRREKSTLVLPSRPQDALALAPHSREFQRLGSSLYLPAPQVVEELIDPAIWPRRLRRAEIAVEPEPGMGRAVGNGRFYEASVCVDVRAPHAILGSSVFELFPESSPSSLAFRAERRKDEIEVEEIVRRVAMIYQVRGVLTVHVRMSADGVPVIAGLAPTPCVYGPLSEGVYEGLRAMWERDQPE